jgi:transcriptional regulator with XRE-family HTH domain
LTRKETWGLKLKRNEKFAALIRSARIEADVGQAALARKISKPQPFLSALESGKIHLTLADFEDVALGLGLNPAALLSRLYPSPEVLDRPKGYTRKHLRDDGTGR